MKSIHIFVTALALAVCCAPALAQHGHPGGMGGGMGGGKEYSLGTQSHRWPSTGCGRIVTPVDSP